jgi:excisionase family DNA binding protein
MNMQQMQSATRPTTDHLSVPQAARSVGVSPATIRRWIKRGYLPGVETPSGWRISPMHLVAAQAAASAARKQRAGARPDHAPADSRAEELKRLAAENETLRQEIAMLTAQRDELLSRLDSAAVRSASTDEAAAPTAESPQRAAAPRTARSELAQRKLEEGILRSIALEETRRRRALRQRNREHVLASERRLVELHARLAEARQVEPVAHGEEPRTAAEEAGERPNFPTIVRPLPWLQPLFATPRRVLNITLVLFLNVAMMAIINVMG